MFREREAEATKESMVCGGEARGMLCPTAQNKTAKNGLSGVSAVTTGTWLFSSLSSL